jgi:hypothetical protein
VFSTQAWFSAQQISDISGRSTEFTRVSDRGKSVTFHFCPSCGSTVYWQAESVPGLIAVAVGAFADSEFPAPSYSVWERRRHEWVAMPDDADLQRSA